MALRGPLNSYDNVILDLDGCVWVGEAPTPRASEAISALREAGKRLSFVTNDARRSPEDYVRKLWSLGCRASLEEVVTVGAAIQFLLSGKPAGTGAYVLGAPALFRHVAEAGVRILNSTDLATEADVVVVGMSDDLIYDDLRIATQAILGGAEMLATGRDRTYPTDGGIAPGTGALVAALEFATGVTAQSVGKPEPQMFRTALDRLGDGPTLVIGDRLDADLAGAAAAGLDGAIVLSGVTSRQEAELATEPAPVTIAADLGTLVLGSH